MSNTQLLIFNQLQDVSTRGSLSTAYTFVNCVGKYVKQHLVHNELYAPQSIRLVVR